MPDVLLPLLAFVAGVISFTSPCTLPLIPSYLSYISGLSPRDLGGEGKRTVVVKASIGFIAGFTVVFTLMGASMALVGTLLLRNLPSILRIAGVFIIVMGIATAGLLRIPVLAREKRFDLSRIPKGPKGAFLLGMAFAFGWTPCIGPILATILAVASASQTVVWGIILLTLYSLGLGIPFLLIAVGFSKANRSLAWLRNHSRGIELSSGLLLVAVGVLFVTGTWHTLMVPIQAKFAQLGWPPI